jgi:hypothetical protein
VCGSLVTSRAGHLFVCLLDTSFLNGQVCCLRHSPRGPTLFSHELPTSIYWVVGIVGLYHHTGSRMFSFSYSDL